MDLLTPNALAVTVILPVPLRQWRVMASFFSTLSHIRGAEGSGLINGLNSSASITNCSPGILKFLIHSECKVSPFPFFIHQQSVLHGAIQPLLLFLTVLSRKRGMFMRRRDGEILFFLLAFSCILTISAAYLTIKGTMS